ncbi:MAG: clan AA aspartic protease [Sphingomonas sp.]|nr:clan AA aspartic protease [Sphingomonas sp.]
MGQIFATIELSNARDDSLAPMNVRALVDTGAVHLCIPAHVALQLKLPVQDRRGVTIADGSTLTVDYVGPIKVNFANRQCLVGALVLGDEALLGAIPMEDMDLVINPARQSLTVNPEHPNLAVSRAMGSRNSQA